jgi:hypothetical protein
MNMTSSEARAALVTKVMALGKSADVSAQYDAVEAIRHPGNEDNQIRARISVARADAISRMAQDVAELINSHWPK